MKESYFQLENVPEVICHKLSNVHCSNRFQNVFLPWAEKLSFIKEFYSIQYVYSLFLVNAHFELQDKYIFCTKLKHIHFLF